MIDQDKLRALDEAAEANDALEFSRFEGPWPGEEWIRRNHAIIRASILAMAEERERSEKHRNDLADKITEQSIEIGALKSDIERHLASLSEWAEEHGRMREAAANVLQQMAEAIDGEAQVMACREAFARHRQEARSAALEEAAKVAEQAGELSNYSGRGSCCQGLGEDIATAIRNLKQSR